MTTLPRSHPMPHFDPAHVHETIARALASAGLDTSTGPMHGVTETIRRALSPGPSPSAGGGGPRPVRTVEVEVEPVDRPASAEPPAPLRNGAPGLPGRFLAGRFSNRSGARDYRLYVPSRSMEESPPLIVMLHGCTQSADDFAAGTQMNRLAEENGFLVLYPEQPATANASKCWNWFRPQDQKRDQGEPSVIAGMVREVARTHGVDERRIFVAGLSAGAAMAVVLGETYPDLVAAVGAHSGLAFASAHDIPSAMSAMKGGRGRGGLAASTNHPGPNCSEPVRTIVFHGDRDHTVQHSNGAAILRRASEAFASRESGDGSLATRTESGTAPGGRTYSRSVHSPVDGRPQLEFWTVHGAGHAWSGGNGSGSYTDATGPDASAEMVRFFLAQPQAGRA